MGELMEGASGQPVQAKRAALRGARYGVIRSLVTQLLTALTTAVLTRLLAPEDFGLIAVATAVAVLFTNSVELGIGASIVQRSQVDRTTESTFFWAATGLGSVAGLVLVALSPPLAGLFGTDDAAPLVAAMGAVVLLGLIGSVPNALLTRRLRFGAVAASEVGGIVTYLVVAITLAASTDLGAWAVIVGRIGAAVIRTLLSFALARWLPSFVFRWAVIRTDFSFNLGYMSSRLANWFTKNVDYVVVGRVFGEETLGIYYLAYVLPNLVRQRITNVADNTLFPVLSRIRKDRDRLARAYLQALMFVAIVVLPAMFGLAAVAGVAVPLIFGSDWAAAAAPMAVLSIGAGLNAVVPAVQALLSADGVPWRSAIIPSARLVALGVGLGVAAYRESFELVAWAVTAATLVAALVAQWLVARRLRIGMLSIIRSLLPAAVPAVGMYILVQLVEGATDSLGRGWLRLGMLIAAGGLAYVGLGFALYRQHFLRVARDVRTILAPRPIGGDADTESGVEAVAP